MLDTHMFGLPQSRPRIYVVAIRCDCWDGNFQWPTPKPMQYMDDIIVVGVKEPEPTSETAQRNLKAAQAKLRQKGSTRNSEIFVDINAGSKFSHMSEDICPCITRARGGTAGFWMMRRHRRLTVSEMALLQGQDELPYAAAGVSESMAGQCIGNAMSQNVM